MKLFISRIRPTEPFVMPELTPQTPSGTIHLSRPVVLRPNCVCYGLTNTAFAIPKGTVAILYPHKDMLYKHSILTEATPITDTNTSEIIAVLRNPTKESVRLTSGIPLLGFTVVSGPKEAVSTELVLRLPIRGV